MREELSLLDKIMKNKKAAAFDLKKINAFMLFLIIASGIYYVAAMNDLSVKGFRLAEIKREAKEFTDDNKNLELRAATLTSLNNLDERIKKLGMTRAGEINYLENSAPEMARK